MPETMSSTEFEMKLRQLLLVIGPPAKSITCLESAHSTVADVYVFWLAVMASLNELIESDALGLPIAVIEKIRRLCNYRFDQMINDGPSDIFVAGFFLDPRMFNSILLLNSSILNHK